MGKGEIARYEQFLLFPQCFQKACFPGASKGVIVWEWVKRYKSSIFGIILEQEDVAQHLLICLTNLLIAQLGHQNSLQNLLKKLSLHCHISNSTYKKNNERSVVMIIM